MALHGNALPGFSPSFLRARENRDLSIFFAGKSSIRRMGMVIVWHALALLSMAFLRVGSAQICISN